MPLHVLLLGDQLRPHAVFADDDNVPNLRREIKRLPERTDGRSRFDNGRSLDVHRSIRFGRLTVAGTPSRSAYQESCGGNQTTRRNPSRHFVSVSRMDTQFKTAVRVDCVGEPDPCAR